jgi:hypothetical protein
MLILHLSKYRCTPLCGSSDKKGIERAAEIAGWDIK